MRLVERLTIPGVRSEAHGERDNGKTFVLTEMDAYSGQRWATKALQALGSGGIHIDADSLKGGFAALAGIAFVGLLRANTDTIQGLLDEMLMCAKYEHQAGQPLQAIVPGIKCCVEEIKTFYTIQRALFTLHTGFSLPAAIPT
jgi:hypothetical protein